MEIVPPLADQVTLVFEDPVTVAENGWVVPVWTDAEVGLMAIVMAGVGGGVFGLEDEEPTVPVQPAKLRIAMKTQKKEAAFHENCRAFAKLGGALHEALKRAGVVISLSIYALRLAVSNAYGLLAEGTDLAQLVLGLPKCDLLALERFKVRLASKGQPYTGRKGKDRTV